MGTAALKQMGGLLVRYLFYNLQMETGSPVSDVGSNILPKSEMGGNLSDDIVICSLDKNSLFSGEFIKCNPLLNSIRN